MLHRLIDRSVTRSLRNEKAWVNDPERARWLLVVDVAMGVAAIAAMGIIGNTESWWDTAARLFLGVYVGLRVLATTRRGWGYRSGWLDGRSAMIRALAEAQRRGIPPADWLEGEYQRDMHVLGLPPLDVRGDGEDR